MLSLSPTLATTGSAAPDLLVAELFDEHAPQVRRILGRMLGWRPEVDDLLQEVFELALARRAELGQCESPRAWLEGVAIKKAQAHRRMAALRHFLSLEFAGEVAGDDDASRLSEVNGARRLVYRALERLSERKRTVFVLYELHGLRGDEIAARLGCPLKTVWSRLAAAHLEFNAALVKLGATP